MSDHAPLEATLARRSALPEAITPGNYGAPGAPGVTIGEVFPVDAALLNARPGSGPALAAALGLRLATMPERRDAGGYAFIWAGRDRWLIIGAASSCVARNLEAIIGVGALLTDMTGALTVIRVEGTRARDSLSKLVSIDLDARAFGAGAAALTMASHIPIHIWHLGARDAFELGCPRSYATSLWSALTPCAAEFGYRVAPFSVETIALV